MTPKEYIRHLKDRPCMDCGVEYPHYVMEFDHVRGEKRANLSDLSGLLGDFAFDVIDEEVAKCDLVCSNCHRERTWRRRHDPPMPRAETRGGGRRTCEGCGAKYMMRRQRQLYGQDFDAQRRCSPGCAPDLWSVDLKRVVDR